MPSGLEHIVFPTKDTLEKDWKLFTKKFQIETPEDYLDAADMPYSSLSRLQIGISTLCNYNCPMCFNHYEKTYNYYKKRELSLEEMERFFEHNMPINDLAFGVSGEPFFHPRIFDIMDIARPYVRTFSVSTNASLLNQNKVKRLSTYSISRILVSVDGSDKETYERFRKNGNFDVFKKNTHYLSEAFGEKVIIAATVFFENQKSIMKMPRLCDELGIKNMVVFRLFEHPKAKEKGIKKLTKEEMKLFMTSFLAECDKYGVTPSWDTRAVDLPTAKAIKKFTEGKYDIDLSQYQNACSLPFHMLLIDTEGNYNFCCALEPIPGNSVITPARELYNTKEIKIMRVLNILGRFPYVCRKYCGKINDNSIEVTLENLKRLIKKEKFEQLEWTAVNQLAPKSKVLAVPCGTMTQELLSGGFFNGSELTAIVDREYNELINSGVTFPLYGYKDIDNLDYDTIVITSGVYWREILLWFLEKTSNWKSKKIYRIDINDRKLRHFDMGNISKWL
jgi:MoaA/NifB/PqqE/SkfB family radical SAM enzyme